MLAEEAPRLPIALVAGRAGLSNRIDVGEVKRPGLALAGYLRGIVPHALYLMGPNETAFLASLGDGRRAAIDRFLGAGPSALLLTDGAAPSDDLREASEAAKVPVLSTTAPEAEAIRFIDVLLERRLAPSTQVHGVLLDVFGIGILLTGESGVGKSETALEMIQRGHRLVADDVVQIRRVHGDLLIGTGTDLIQHHMEIRGLGVIDVRRLFGVAAILEEQQIDLAVHLEAWREEKEYDRLGLDSVTTSILGIEVPRLLIPVQPGRNLAVIIESGALNLRLKSMGQDIAREFSDRLARWIDESAPGAVVRRRRSPAGPRRRPRR